MGLKITIGLAGEKEVSRTLAVSLRKVKDLRPAWDELERILNQFQKGVFLSKGQGASKQWYGVNASSGLKKWDALKPATIAGKRGKYATYPLIRTEKLMKAFTQNKADGAIRVKFPKLFIWGIDESEIPYAKYHQLGTSRLPVRKPLRVPENLRKIVPKVIQRFLATTGQLQRTVFGGGAR